MKLEIIKRDLLNQLANEKYYLETELQRLVSDNTIGHKERILQISEVMVDIALVNTKIELTNNYFVDKAPEVPQGQPQGEENQQQPVAEQTKTHPGQTHGE